MATSLQLDYDHIQIVIKIISLIYLALSDANPRLLCEEGMHLNGKH